MKTKEFLKKEIFEAIKETIGQVEYGLKKSINNAIDKWHGIIHIADSYGNYSILYVNSMTDINLLHKYGYIPLKPALQKIGLDIEERKYRISK